MRRALTRWTRLNSFQERAPREQEEANLRADARQAAKM